MSRVYAIGFGDWVELRTADKAPVLHKTSSTRVVDAIKQVRGPADWYGYYTYKDVTYKKKLTISITIHRGGKVIGCVPHSKFTRITGLPLKRHETIAVPQDVQETLLKAVRN